jgi:hypothetical protein
MGGSKATERRLERDQWRTSILFQWLWRRSNIGWYFGTTHSLAICVAIMLHKLHLHALRLEYWCNSKCSYGSLEVISAILEGRDIVQSVLNSGTIAGVSLWLFAEMYPRLCQRSQVRAQWPSVSFKRLSGEMHKHTVVCWSPCVRPSDQLTWTREWGRDPSQVCCRC